MSTLRAFKRRRKIKPVKPFAKLKKKLSENELLEGQKIIYQPSGEVKMSEVLMAFVEPYREYVRTEEEHRKLLILAVLAWNASLLPEKEQKEMVSNVIDEVMPFDTKELKGIIEMMIVRKKLYFSDNHRKIIDFELTDLGDDLHISVASTL